MRITRLTLNNFRGVVSLPLELHGRLNVFAGVNGAGKSTVLDAAAIMLSWVVNRIKSVGASARPITDSDIQNGKSTATLDLACQCNERYYQWKLVKTRKGRIRRDEQSDLQEVSALAKHFQSLITSDDARVNLPLMVYYPVNRAVLDIPLRIKGKHQFDVLAAYDESLTSGANFRTFFEWFRNREDQENENRKYSEYLIKPEGFQFPDLQLETVRSAITQFMPDVSDLTVRRNPLRMELTKRWKKLTVDQLSDGEKCLMAMIGDLARRIAIANPGSNKPEEGRGIVIIDEIDLHLHPKWQRLIVPKLLEIFPHCQFVISTHSPHVITHVQPESLFLLDQTDAGIVVERPSTSYGKNVDRILEDLMGLPTTRPEPVRRAISNIFDLVDAGKISQAEDRIDALKKEIGEDPELVKAAVLIKRKELIGK